MSDDAIAALRLAGFALAHAAWSIEDGETLCTLAMVDVGSESIELNRYEADSIPESVDLAHQDLTQRLENGGHAALVIDGYSTFSEGDRTDALMVELFGPGRRSLGKVVQPYRAARRSRIPSSAGQQVLRSSATRSSRKTSRSPMPSGSSWTRHGSTRRPPDCLRRGQTLTARSSPILDSRWHQHRRRWAGSSGAGSGEDRHV